MRRGYRLGYETIPFTFDNSTKLETCKSEREPNHRPLVYTYIDSGRERVGSVWRDTRVDETLWKVSAALLYGCNMARTSPPMRKHLVTPGAR